MDFGSERESHKAVLSSSNLEKGDGAGEKDHSPATDPVSSHRPEKLHKNGSGSTGSTDDFEHISSDSYPAGSGGGENLLHDFLGASQTQYDNVKSDFGREFSQTKTAGAAAAKEIMSDFMTGFDDKIAQTRDFMTAERQGFAATPSQPPTQKPKQQPLVETVVPPPIKEPPAPPKESSREPMNIFESPVKKIAKEDTEKFISSEDLLGILPEELMDDQKIPEPVVPKKPTGLVPAVPIIPIPPATVTVTPVVVPSPVKIIPKLPEPMPKVIEKPAAVVPQKPIEPVKVAAADPPKPTAQPAPKQSTTPMISAEEMFCRFGLVESLIYWRDVKKSGIVFGAGLVILLAISCFSVISVFAYLSLLTLAGTVAFRIYKNVLGAIQKTSEGHPFKDYLELDLTISQEKAQNVVTIVVAHFNGFICELRRLFLVDDLVDSLKFSVLLFMLTYIGAWFNGMTLVILAFVALFTLPKVYENNKQSIDTYLDLVRSKFLEITDKVKAAIPIGKKQETDKDK